MFTACERAVQQQTTDLDFIRIDADAFSACPADSIDYAVMESLASEGQVVVSQLDGGWSDIGSWSSLAQQYPADANNNIVIGNGQSPATIFEDSRNTIVCGDERLIATLGIDNLIIADTPEALLVARRDQDQNIKQLLKTVKRGTDNGEIQPGLSSRIGHRPWGYYQVVTSGDGYKVKKICVNPGASLSLQRHQHRAEHWVVVSGCAQVTRGAETYSVNQNQSTYISPREVHKLENNSREPLVIIEVQTGRYLEEDDIERLEDRYGR
jgi:mannose-1-phosphate guanylyltransferase/mannose-6-phosphate isomerase